MTKLLFFHFQVTNSNLENIKLHFELLTQSQFILETQIYLYLTCIESHQQEASFGYICLFGHSQN